MTLRETHTASRCLPSLAQSAKDVELVSIAATLRIVPKFVVDAI